LQHALSSNRPALVEVIVDPFEPPMPPRVTAKQALHLAEALAKGEPGGGKIALTLFRDKLNELI
jgi:pyruvate dehydrogenase (quinone)/pyruvate oxidase